MRDARSAALSRPSPHRTVSKPLRWQARLTCAWPSPSRSWRRPAAWLRSGRGVAARFRSSRQGAAPWWKAGRWGRSRPWRVRWNRRSGREPWSRSGSLAIFASSRHGEGMNLPDMPTTEGKALWANVPEERRAVMRAVKGQGTRPEMVVRRLVHGMGYRYRLHRTDLPGKPDLAFGPRKKAIFVHGCFWHQHHAAGCRGARVPVTRADYWRRKLERNTERDKRAILELGRLGWRVLVVWECSLKDIDRTRTVVTRFLDEGGKGGKHE